MGGAPPILPPLLPPRPEEFTFAGAVGKSETPRVSAMNRSEAVRQCRGLESLSGRQSLFLLSVHCAFDLISIHFQNHVKPAADRTHYIMPLIIRPLCTGCHFCSQLHLSSPNGISPAISCCDPALTADAFFGYVVLRVLVEG